MNLTGSRYSLVGPAVTRQRIGLARAFYRNKQIFALDEATSALDFNTEKEIFKILR